MFHALPRRGRTLAAVVLTALLGGTLAPLAGQPAAADIGPVDPIVSPANGLTVSVDKLYSTPSMLDYDHPTATITGRVRLFDPSQGDHLAHSGGTVTPVLPSGTGSTGTVAEDGTFTVNATPRGFGTQTEEWEVALRWTPDSETLAAFGAPFPSEQPVAIVELDADYTTFRIVLDSASVRVNAPARAVVSGVVQRQRAFPDWEAVSSVDVLVGGTLVTSGSSGRFSAEVSVASDSNLQVTLADPESAYLFDGWDIPRQTVEVDVVPRPTLVLTQGNRLYPNGYLNYSAELRYDDSEAKLGDERLYLQESKNGKTGWSHVKLIKGGWEQSDFFGLVKLKHPHWYFRLVYPGNATLQPVKSAVFKPGRYPTRIIRFKLAREKPYQGQIILSGKVQKYKNGSWVNLGQKVRFEVWFKPKGKRSRQYDIPLKRSKKSGAFQLFEPNIRDGHWWVVARVKSSKYVWAYSKPVYMNAP